MNGDVASIQGEINEIKQKVSELFEAENEGKRDVAERILAADFPGITRASGKADSSRVNTLEKIAKTNSARLREVDEIDVTLFEETVAIARTRLKLKLLEQEPPGVEYYQNMHVFLKRGENWECVAWQVTRSE